jgi:hypothetical protein
MYSNQATHPQPICTKASIHISSNSIPFQFHKIIACVQNTANLPSIWSINARDMCGNCKKKKKTIPSPYIAQYILYTPLPLSPSLPSHLNLLREPRRSNRRIILLCREGRRWGKILVKVIPGLLELIVLAFF